VSTCCGPSRPSSFSGVADVPDRAGPSSLDEMVVVPAGRFRMGSDDPWAYPDDGEGPVHDVDVSSFRIDATAVTNRQFAEFVEATRYVTEAQRYGWSFVFGGLLPDEFPPTRGVASAPWWRQVPDTDWSHPEGPHSGVAERMDHPVVHISWRDAGAFCRWAGKRLPTEAEWEYAARGGSDGAVFPWGDELEPDGAHCMNVWQGTFPSHNSRADGFLGTAPVTTYGPNGYGLYNMTGNVWEWCADWYDAAYYGASERRDPKGPEAGTRRVMRGGSYLCHESYCRRYRVAARGGNAVESSVGNLGFRCVVDERSSTRSGARNGLG
jgi:sulfatase modifying factor 1